MIYASDLDRTLIYSQTFLDMHPTESKTILVDKSKVNSYMTEEVANLLEEVNNHKKIRFIPVTTRSEAEYKRVQFKGIVPEYAIVASGARILHNGELMQEWEDYLNPQLNIDELKMLVDEFNNLESTNYESKIIDGAYVFSKSGDIAKTKVELNALREKYPQYKFYLDKHKVYAIPNCFGKGITLKWLKQYLDEKFIIASGDTTFDMPMLQEADLAIIPSHKTIKEDELKELAYVEIKGGADSPVTTLNIVKHYVE